MEKPGEKGSKGHEIKGQQAELKDLGIVISCMFVIVNGKRHFLSGPIVHIWSCADFFRPTGGGFVPPAVEEFSSLRPSQIASPVSHFAEPQ